MADVTQKNNNFKVNKDGNLNIKKSKKNEEENFIQLKKSSILKFGIKDENGKPTGEHLEFDLESIEYPLRLNKCEIMHKKNLSELNASLKIIEKQEDVKGKYILSRNQEDQLNAYNVFFQKEMEAVDLFLGKGGAKKLLNGRDMYITFYNDFIEIIKPILPKIKMRAEDIKKSIIEKYKNNSNKSDVLK